MKNGFIRKLAGLFMIPVLLTAEIPALAAPEDASADQIYDGTGDTDDAGMESVDNTLPAYALSSYYPDFNWANPEDSYLWPDGNGGFTSIGSDGTWLYFQELNSKFKEMSMSAFTLPLPIFGGAYKADDGYYAVYGESNTDESDTKEVVRVVHYDKEMTELASCSIKGINTNTPFEAGSLRMTMNGSDLYIHTCHKMYKSSDGLNHQANMFFKIDTAKMECTESHTGFTDGGYSSHSFNQFILNDGTYLYRADHGDAYPRAVVVNKASLTGSVASVTKTYAFTIPGATGANATGVTLEGFEQSASNLLLAGTSVPLDDADNYSASAQRNIYLTVIPKSFTGSSDATQATTKYLTSFTGSSYSTKLRYVHLVKISADSFALMWTEVSGSDSTEKIMLIDGSGNIKKAAQTIEGAEYSDMQPVYSDGKIYWFRSNGKAITYYSVSTSDFTVQEGGESVTPSTSATATPVPTSSSGGGENDPTPAPGGDDTTPTPTSSASGSGSSKTTPTPTPVPTSGSALVTPTPAPEHKVTEIDMGGSSASRTYTAGETVTLNAKVTTADGQAADVNYVNSNPHIAAPVSATSGSASYKLSAPGTAFVTVASGTKTKTVKYTVKQPAGKLEAFYNGAEVSKLSSGNYFVSIMQGEKLSLMVHPDKASTDTIKWVSDTPSVVKVNSSGVIMAKKTGNATIKAISMDGKKEGASVNFKVKVSAAPQEKIEKYDATKAVTHYLGSKDANGNPLLYAGEMASVYADVTANTGWNSGKAIVYKVVDGKGVIKTDKFGRITAKKTGTATIAAYCGKTKLEGSEISIRVRTPIKLFKLSKDYIKVKSGSSKQKSVSLAVKTNPAYKVLKEEGSYIKWSVPAGYTIKAGSDQNGKVTYIFPAGVADRTATAVIYDAVTGVTYTATVTIDMQ